MHRWHRRDPIWVVVIAAGVALLPWLAAAVPTQDGPSHLYNAWVIVHLGDPALGLGQHFELIPQAPNWGGVGPLVLLLQVLPPLDAEKLLMSLLLAGLVLAVAAVARAVEGDAVLLALLAGIVSHGFLFVMGFTAYQLALVAAFALAAWELRRPLSDGVPAGRAALPALALGALFFVHMAGALVAAALWTLAALLRRRRTWRNTGMTLATLVPVVALLVGHAALRAGTPSPEYRPDSRGPGVRLVDLVSGNCWEAFGPEDRVVGSILVVLVLGLVVIRLRADPPPERGAGLFLLAGGACAAGYLVVPWALAGGAFLPDRLVPLLVLLPALGATAGVSGRTWLRALAALLLVGALGIRARQYRHWGEIQVQLTAQVPRLPRGATVQMTSRPVLDLAVDPLTHVWARVAVRDGVVALNDYEASLVGLFPVAFRASTLDLAKRVGAGEHPPGVVPFGWR